MKSMWPNLTENPFGIYIAHTWDEVGEIFRAIDKYNVVRFIEIGTHRGGLTSFMVQRARYDPHFFYWGIEIDRSLIDPRILADVNDSPRAWIWNMDAFSEDAFRRVEMFIQPSPGPVMVYCDGGNKPKEVQAYYKFLRPGDIIAAHDYGHEIHEEDFKDLTDDFLWINKDFGEDVRIGMMRRRYAAK